MRTLMILGWSLLTVTVQAQSLAKSTEKVTSAAQTVQPKTNITGVWRFVTNVGERNSADKKVKIILDKNWMFSQSDPTTNLTLFHHGGTYSLDGSNYSEKINYANESTEGYLGTTFNYRIELTGDTLTLRGIGNPYNEIWQRVR